MTDREYTKAVDKGKGKYKTPAGKKRSFNTDYFGYGLCQWTSLGRRAKLLNKALEKKVSIGDADMQLEFMIEELQKSYPAVWKTLQSVPDNAAGAYLAAQHFCLAYEIPANTVAVAASRGKAVLNGYWRTYGGKAANPTAKSYMGLCGYSYPDAVKKGRALPSADMPFLIIRLQLWQARFRTVRAKWSIRRVSIQRQPHTICTSLTVI